MKPHVAVLGILRFPPEHMDEIRPALRELVESTRCLDGCLAYDVAEDLFEPGLLRFAELWPDHESLDRHLLAPHIEPWRSVARRCGLQERRFTAYSLDNSRPV